LDSLGCSNQQLAKALGELRECQIGIRA
jgi:hypothetical protein